MNWRRPLLCGAAMLIVAPPPPPPVPDLDVGIPPGSPASWGRRFPAITPRRGPLFPITPRGRIGKPKTERQDANRTVVPVTTDTDVSIASAFGVVRILTWDLDGHLRWVARTPRAQKGPITGPTAGKVRLPPVTDGLYWANMASLLRLMLHPQLVSENELIAHLVEIGEPLLAVLDNSVSEASLQPPSVRIRRMITAPAGSAAPLAGSTPRETMLKRFLAEELVAAYPYDPEGGFGRRFFLFADEIEPYLIEYAGGHAGSFLRRNAVSAVGRYRSARAMRALSRIAARTGDPVVLMRALAALGGYRSLPRVDRDKLLRRMIAVTDPVAKIAFVVAAGRMGMHEAVPYLLSLADRSANRDLFQAVVTALARIPHPPGHTAVTRFAKRVGRLTGSHPERFRVPERGGPKPDVPDSAKVRGDVIHQLALMLQVRVGGEERDAAAKKLLGFVQEPAARPRRPARPPARGRGRRRGPTSRRTAYRNTSMPEIQPPAQMLFLETLKLLGAPGQEALEQIARDVTMDPALRGHALGQLSWKSRGDIAAEIMGGRSTEAKIHAIEVLNNAGHDSLRETCRDLLESAVARHATSAPELRYLWLQALRALSRRGLLKTGDVLPLMVFPETRKPAGEDVRQQAKAMVEKLVADAAKGLPGRAVTRRIDALLEFLFGHGLGRRLAKQDRKVVRDQVRKRLDGLEGHRADKSAHSRVAQSVLVYLTGFTMGMSLKERATFHPVVMLEEEVLLALGRTRTREAGDALARFLEKHAGHPLRAYAALALGMVGKLTYARHLVPVLHDADGFTRFCAYESLRHLTGREVWADWMYGNGTSRKLAAAWYRKMVGGK